MKSGRFGLSIELARFSLRSLLHLFRLISSSLLISLHQTTMDACFPPKKMKCQPKLQWYQDFIAIDKKARLSRSALASDILSLLQTFISQPSLRFRSFLQVWHGQGMTALHFACLFEPCRRSFMHDMYAHCLKHLVVSTSTLGVSTMAGGQGDDEEAISARLKMLRGRRIAVVYAVYLMYFTQPPRFPRIPIPVTPDVVDGLEQLLTDLSGPPVAPQDVSTPPEDSSETSETSSEADDVRRILGKLRSSGALAFTAFNPALFELTAYLRTIDPSGNMPVHPKSHQHALLQRTATYLCDRNDTELRTWRQYNLNALEKAGCPRTRFEETRVDEQLKSVYALEVYVQEKQRFLDQIKTEQGDGGEVEASLGYVDGVDDVFRRMKAAVHALVQAGKDQEEGDGERERVKRQRVEATGYGSMPVLVATQDGNGDVVATTEGLFGSDSEESEHER
jgi:hypothetical protein